MKYLALLPVLILAACSSTNRPTPSQCEATYAAAVAACDVALTTPDDVARCHAAAVAIRLACLIAAEPPAAPTGKTTANAGQSKADRWAQAYPALTEGSITPEAFEAFVLGGSDGPR